MKPLTIKQRANNAVARLSEAGTNFHTPEDWARAARVIEGVLRQLLDSRIAKTEREWVGGREIERLRGIIARNARTRLSGDDGPLFVTPEDIKASLEILYAEMEREDSPNSQAEQNYETNSI